MGPIAPVAGGALLITQESERCLTSSVRSELRRRQMRFPGGLMTSQVHLSGWITSDAPGAAPNRPDGPGNEWRSSGLVEYLYSSTCEGDGLGPRSTEVMEV